MRSASVDLPWSMWAMMEKFLMLSEFILQVNRNDKNNKIRRFSHFSECFPRQRLELVPGIIEYFSVIRAMVSFDSDICTDFPEASSREWLETNGIGGFASATVAGSNSRRYHGLLVAAARPPVGRAVLLSKFEEALTVGKETFLLSVNQYPGAVFPQGYRLLKNFRLDPFPMWTFEVAGIELEKSVLMVHGENTTVIQYNIKNQKPGEHIRLEIKPLVAFRDYHHLGQERAVNHDLTIGDGHVSIRPVADLPELYFAHTEAGVRRTGEWYRNFEYEIERERGFDFHEDLFNPFSLSFDLSEPKEISVIASTEPREISDALSFRLTEIARREALLVQANAKDDLTRQLTLAADQFLVARGEEKTVIAGYPWFTDWGRDTMIALPGLTLSTNRFEVAESILLEFSKYISRGMLPNRFPDAHSEPEYNTADATLWYFEAIRAYARAAKDLDFVKRNLYEKLQDIVDCHLRGTRYGIKADPRRPAECGRGRRAADLDGRENRRLGGDAAHRQGGGNSGALV